MGRGSWTFQIGIFAVGQQILKHQNNSSGLLDESHKITFAIELREIFFRARNSSKYSVRSSISSINSKCYRFEPLKLQFTIVFNLGAIFA